MGRLNTRRVRIQDPCSPLALSPSPCGGFPRVGNAGKIGSADCERRVEGISSEGASRLRAASVDGDEERFVKIAKAIL